MGYRALAFMRRDFQTQASYRLDFLMRIGGTLISVSIFFFVSQVFGSAVTPYLERYGTDYFNFALLGIAFYPFIDLSMNVLSSVLQGYQHSGTLEVLLLVPTPFLASLLMSTLWSYCWVLGESVFYLLVGSVVYHAELDWGNIQAAVVGILLTISANTGLGLINASFVLVTKRPSPLSRLLSLVTGLLAGVFVPIAVLPDWLRSISLLLPATYSFDALRRIMLQGASLAEVRLDLLALIGFTAILMPIGLVVYRYALRWAKLDGSLAQY